MKNWRQLEIPFEIEEWRPVVGYEGKYQVSNHGRVRSLNYNHEIGCNKIMNGKKEKNGYYRIMLYNNGQRKTHSIHRLVADAFIPNPDNLPIVNHKDECKSNNYVDNLEWCTASYNSSYGNSTKKQWESRRKNDPENRWVRKMLLSHSKNNSCNAQKPVKQYSLNNELLNIWASASEASKNTSMRRHICDCCNGQRKTAYGYKWEYA